MYFPYFRGKQFELLTIRETSHLLAASQFVPIIEPVREALGGLQKALKAVVDQNARAIVIVNPRCGDHQEDGAGIRAALQEAGAPGSLAAGILLTSTMRVEDAVTLYEEMEDFSPVLIHSGFTDGKALSEEIGSGAGDTNIFLDEHSGKLYRRHFANSNRILLRDGFKKKKNADYPAVEKFSDLHVTYRDEGMIGFGDFLIVGDEYSEGGGPAYAVAIHLTYVDTESDDEMYINHFVSKSNLTPTDPAGKFSEALDALIDELDSGESKIINSGAVLEFRELHRRGHFPGLGYVKKLSMKHHIETLAAYLGR